MKLGFVDPVGKLIVIELNGKKIVRVATVDKGIPKYTSLEGLNYSLAGIIKKFPDLEGQPVKVAKREAVKRLREKLDGMQLQSDVIAYIVEDLGKYGYKYTMHQKPGHRPIKAKP